MSVREKKILSPLSKTASGNQHCLRSHVPPVHTKLHAVYCILIANGICDKVGDNSPFVSMLVCVLGTHRLRPSIRGESVVICLYARCDLELVDGRAIKGRGH